MYYFRIKQVVEKMKSYNRASAIGLVLGPLILLFIVLFPIQQLHELSFGSKIVLASTIWMAIWWITEIVPIYVTALLPLIIFPLFNVISFTEASSNYADRIIFLFLGGFLLAKAVEKSNLHKRFAFHILKLFGTNPKYIVAAFMLVTWFIGAWMSNTATTILMLPIALAVSSLFKDAKDRNKFVVCLLLSVAYSASIGGVTTLIGTPPNAIFASLANSLTGIDITFSQWLILGVPISGISLVILWFYMTRFGAKITDIRSNSIGDKNIITKKLRDLGPITRDEKLVTVIFVVTIVAWVSRGILWKDAFPMIDDSMIAIIMAIILFLLPSTMSHKERIEDRDIINDKYSMSKTEKTSFNSNLQNNNYENDVNSDRKTTPPRLLDWSTAVTIPWGVLILIGGGLALADGFVSSGLDNSIAQRLGFLGNVHYVIIILIFVTLAILPTEMISNTATAALLLPIAASLATSMNLNPILLMAPVAVASSYGFIMPVGTPPNAIVHSTGFISVKRMAKAGIPLDLISIVLVTVLTSVLVPLVFGNT
jgi:solute carrier family 13 (sodium-dependent dicarboxylate transporter), member 2/3/5